MAKLRGALPRRQSLATLQAVYRGGQRGTGRGQPIYYESPNRRWRATKRVTKTGPFWELRDVRRGVVETEVSSLNGARATIREIEKSEADASPVKTPAEKESA